MQPLPPKNAYQQLANSLNALPNGFPLTPDGSELRLLEALYSPEEASLAAALTAALEPPASVASRTGCDATEAQRMLKSMARRGLVNCQRGERGLVYSLLPFVVGVYENQVGRIDAELARRFETYFKNGFGSMLTVQPQVHRVIPVQEAVRIDIEIAPYNSVDAILDQAQSWGVMDCICRKQKTLVGEPCKHPVGVCMVLGKTAGMFDNASDVRALSRAEAKATLKQAAEAGLVHSVSNTQEAISYICNCCTCSCGILRGIAELGVANAVARSPYVIHVDEARCAVCGACIEACMFGALTMGITVESNEMRCVGCGLCVQTCLRDALALIERPTDQVRQPPVTEAEWGQERLAYRSGESNK